MVKIAVLFADGTEEIEGITPVDILRRAGAECDIVSVAGEYLTGSHGITIKADKLINKIDVCSYDAVVIPGGMPGATNIAKNEQAIELIKHLISKGKLVAAICASPAVVLAQNDLLMATSATCFHADCFTSQLGKNYTGKEVEVSDNFITADGPKSALKFAMAIAKYLQLDPNM